MSYILKKVYYKLENYCAVFRFYLFLTADRTGHKNQAAKMLHFPILHFQIFFFFRTISFTTEVGDYVEFSRGKSNYPPQHACSISNETT